MVSQTPKVNFQVVFQGDNPRILLPARLSILEAVSFKTKCQQLLDAETVPEKIILDFKQTTFVDSSGIGALVSVLKAATGNNIELVLQHVGPQVTAVLSLTSLDQVLTIENTSGEPIVTETRPVDNKQLPVTHPSVRSWVKRFIDILGAIVGLSITAVLSVPIVIAILLDSPGPIFFGQIRCGWMGKHFKIWKFRSMIPDAEARKSEVKNQATGAIFKNDNDPRITKVGGFLRRTSLDELPQFWNVLKGDMSLVGTRPPTPDEVERYEVPQWQRLDVKPGMTGEWQVNGRSQIKNFEDIIRLDLKYQENWSLVYDMKLIFKTIMILFQKSSGAM
ncbi:MAG: STAS domain-containing protein [Oscillatoriales cyanobacterium RM2_1_1]|nr:STAS domain-containing protein [Oscillatoriales cyanobacterium SM2_3_0]NJO47454.1 STAS domain-containing protein [Oscillatoriales cyanobacterium RM2_1_1]